MIQSNNNPLLTIIIPTFNSAATLEVALESIIIQTLKNIEVLILDNLSTDKTVKIAKKYKNEFPYIKIIIKKDNGIYDAMNKGIDMAQGKWLYFMGCDDSLYEITTLEQCLNSARLKTLDVIYGDVYSTRFNGVYDGEFTYSKLAFKNICHQSIFFKKSIFNKTGKFDTKYKIHADWDHNIKWLFSSKISKAYINQIIANYADDGFSSRFEDEIFRKDKKLKLIYKGLGKIPLSQLINYCTEAITESTERRATLQILKLNLLKLSFKIIHKIKTLKSR